MEIGGRCTPLPNQDQRMVSRVLTLLLDLPETMKMHDRQGDCAGEREKIQMRCQAGARAANYAR